MLKYLLLLALALPLQAQTALELADKLPAENAAAGQAVLADLVKLGEPGLRALAEALVPAGTGDDTKFRFALNGLVYYVSRPGAEAERQLLSTTLLAALAARTEPEVRGDLIRFLQRCGGPEAVAPLAALLHDEQLGAPAAAALLSIGGDEVTQAFVKALPDAGVQQVTIIEALGQLGAKAAVPGLVQAAGSDDRMVRQAAWDALSRLGEPAAVPALLKASQVDDVRDRTVATAACLRLAEGLPKADGAKLCRELLASHTGEAETHAAADALTTLVRLVGADAAPQLFGAVASPYADLRRAAADLLVKLPGDAVRDDIISGAEQGEPAARAELIRVLRLRGETAASELILRACADPDPLVREAALQAAATLATPEAVQSIAKAAGQAEGDQARTLNELLRQLRAEKVLEPCLGLWPDATPGLKIVILNLLTARGGAPQRTLVGQALTDADAGVRRAAAMALGAVSTPADLPDLLASYLAADAKDRGPLLNAVVATARREPDLTTQGKPLQAAYDAADEAGKLALLDIWDALAGPVAMQAIQAAKMQPGDIGQVATDILDGWRDSGEINLAERRPVTTSVAQQGNHTPELAVDGNSSDKANSAWFGDAWPSWYRVDLGAAVPLDAVQIWFYWDSRYYQYTVDVSPDAKEWTTVVDATENTKPADATGVTQRFAPTVGRYVRLNILKNSANEAVHLVEFKVYAEGTLPVPKPPAPPVQDEEGFIALFNGTDLTGWTGATNGYQVEDGNLVCIPEIGGKLMTEREYSDFILRFDFRLTPGTNNGVGIRAPLPGDAAYNGMEIQILDDTAAQYAKLQPYQYHGSVYGVCPCERGHQMPLGEWNSEEIRAWDRRITVTLNGVVITDCDLDEARLPFTLDHKDHPGLMNETGHIGFLGHGSRVELRNIRIREIE